jgi:hypothetical protein
MKTAALLGLRITANHLGSFLMYWEENLVATYQLKQ